MRQASLVDHFRYGLDNLVSRGASTLIGLLAAASGGVILLISALGWLIGVSPADGALPPGVDGLLQLTWMGLMRTLDAGTMGGDKGSPAFLLVMLAFTFAGIFVVSLFIGLLTSVIEAKIEEVRKGRSLVLERNHQLILGWSSKIYTILDQLIEANQSERRPCIVILAEKDKVEMEDEIRARVREPGRVRIICRTGSPMEHADLEIVNPDDARAIIVLSPEDDDPDSGAIKSVLALTNNPRRKQEHYHIITELRSRRNLKLLKRIGKNEVESIDAHALIARMMVQTCRQSGLSAVYADLLDFGGVEIYFTDATPLAGRTFGQALLAYEHSSVIGLRTAAGKCLVGPQHEIHISPGDRLIVISEDDSTVKLTGVNESGIDKTAMVNPPAVQRQAERTLVLGWNFRGPQIINELAQYVAPGSEVVIAAELEQTKAEVARDCRPTPNLAIRCELTSTTDREALDALDVPSFDHVILLCYSGHLTTQQADARTLVTLLHLRCIAEDTGAEFSIVSEMLDMRNRELAEAGRPDDFIVSDRLISLLMAQVAESKELNGVFEDLFDPEGAEIYLKPGENYVVTGREVTYRTLVAAARKRGEVAIGYRKTMTTKNGTNTFGVVLNPAKSSLITIEPGDKLIVVAAS